MCVCVARKRLEVMDGIGWSDVEGVDGIGWSDVEGVDGMVRMRRPLGMLSWKPLPLLPRMYGWGGEPQGTGSQMGLGLG